MLHSIISNAFRMFAIIIALWAFLHFYRQNELEGGFWGAVAIGEILIILQAIIGFILMFKGGVPARGVHYIYGILAVLSWPAVFAFSRGGTGRKEALYWGLVSLFLFGIATRAVMTALPA